MSDMTPRPAQWARISAKASIAHRFEKGQGNSICGHAWRNYGAWLETRQTRHCQHCDRKVRLSS